MQAENLDLAFEREHFGAVIELPADILANALEMGTARALGALGLIPERPARDEAGRATGRGPRLLSRHGRFHFRVLRPRHASVLNALFSCPTPLPMEGEL